MAVSDQVTPARKPIRCLVIQLTRLGDTLQSLMALRAAKQLYPELEIHFLARERFAGAAKRVPWISGVVTLPSDALLGPVISGKRTEQQAIAELAHWARPLVQEPWDMVVNWSYSDASSHLTGLLPGRVKLGYSRREDASFSATDGWSHYVQAIIQGGIRQNIHLTDILTTQLLTALQIHYGDPANDGNSPVTSKSFFTLRMNEREMAWLWRDLSRRWIAVQLGAGQAAKTWDPESWARMVSYVLKRHPNYGIVLLGGGEDSARVQRFMDALDVTAAERRSIVSLVGETDFDLWASVVSRCQWVFSGDTAVVHLASVLGTRVLNVSVGPVLWAETGPYGNGHYVVSSSMPCEGCDRRDPDSGHSCRADVTAEAAYAAWAYAASERDHRRQHGLAQHFANLGFSERLGSVRVFRSRIRDTADGGGVHYEPLTQAPLELGDWGAMVTGHIARAWYCGWVPPVGQELPRDLVGPELVKRLRELDESATVLAKICGEATQAAGTLNQKSSKLKSDRVMNLSDKAELQEIGTKLLELDALVERMGNVHGPLRSFARMSKVLMHNLRGNQLSELGKESAECYRQLGEGVAILRTWIRHTLELARPVALKVVGSAARPEGNPPSPGTTA